MDNANKLKAQLLSECSTEQQRKFAKMLAEECAEADLHAKGHKCWFFVPSEFSYNIMKKYVKDDTCPKCKKGRIVCEIFKDHIGQSFNLKCYWGVPGCDFKEDATDVEGW